MKWKEAKAALKDAYEVSFCAQESGSFSSLIHYFSVSAGCQTPMFPDSDLTLEQFEQMLYWMEQVKNGCPPQYAVGKVWFDCGEFFVGEGVLIPRPDTEILVDFASQRLAPNGIFYDLCCGSGCVGVSVLMHRPDARCIACDIAEAPLCYTAKNALHNGVADRHKTIYTDVLSPDISSLEKVDLVVSNPPYLTKDEMRSLPILLEKEPREALDGGEDGLIFYRAILKNFQKISSRFLFEIGAAQAEEIQKIARENGFEQIEVGRDYGGRDRIVYCEKKKI